MYTLRTTKGFRRALSRCSRQKNFKEKDLKKVVDTLLSGKSLSSQYKDHKLKGSLKGLRECHIAPNMLLLYKVENNLLVLTLVELGSHSDVFK